MAKPSLPQGTRDFGPDVVRKRNHIFQTIRKVFELYGYQPLETPAMENLDTLLGKYGDEGDKLIFKILNNGLDNPDKESRVRADFDMILQGKNVKGITERALRYDLTIPFARYVAMNHGQLVYPFKRYQLQPVWRADRPQKGRYREFYQCDADVVGSTSLLNEAEFCHIYHDVFTALGLTGYELLINHRAIITALAERCGGAERMNMIAVAIDKLEKTGPENVKEELAKRGFTAEQLEFIGSYLSIRGTNEEKLDALSALLGDSATATRGIREIREVTEKALIAPSLNLTIDPALARGLNYYTGMIFEVKAPATVKMGSIGGGGRYDDLTGLFGITGISGVGISFGVDRIYDVLEELDLFPATVHTGTKALFFNLGEPESRQAFILAKALRMQNISCEVYPDPVKLDKQFKYAEKKNIPRVIIIGSRELAEKTCTVKHLETGEQKTIPQADLPGFGF